MTESNQITAPQPTSAPGPAETFATCLAGFIAYHGLTRDQVAYLGLPASLDAEIETARELLSQLIAEAAADPAASGPASPAGAWERGWRAGLAADPDLDTEAERTRIEHLAASTPRALPVPVLMAAWEDGYADAKRRSGR